MGKADFKKTNEPLGDGISNGKPKKKKIRVKRADHKHVYETVLLDKVMLNNGNYWGHYMVADVCTICKRVVLKKTMITIREPQGWYRALTNEEVLELSEYKDLPILDAEKEGLKCW